MGLFNLFKASKTTVVIDGVSLNEALGMKGKVPPRNQLQLLRRLARFADREKVAMTVVLTGAPLHKAPAGKKFEGITVTYTKSPETHAKQVVKVAASCGSGAILVSGNTGTEKAAISQRLKTMRIATFRKAFDTGGGEAEAPARQERSGSERGGRSRPQRRKQKQSGGEKQQQPERPPKDTSEADAINELIDLVD